MCIEFITQYFDITDKKKTEWKQTNREGEPKQTE